MNDLATRPLSDAIDKIIDFRGKTPLKLGMEWGGGDIRALSANNVTQGKIDFSKECYYASEALYNKWMNKGSCAQGDILLTMEAPLGNVAQIPDDKKYILSQRTVLIKLNQNKILNDYAFYLFSFDNFQKELYKNATGSTVIGIQQKKLLKIELTYPFLITNQKKIAKILSTCDTVISQTEQAIEKYQAIKQGMMTDLFTRGIDVNTGKLRSSYEEQPDLYKESELGWIPRDWEVEAISSFADVVTGSTPSTLNKYYYDGQFMFISPSDISNQKYIYQTEKTLTKLGLLVSRVIPTGSICVVCIGSTIGKIALTTSNSTTNQQINSIIPYDKDLSEFVFYASKHYLNNQLKVEAGLQAVPIVNKSSFEKLLLPTCNDIESKMITKQLTVLDCKIDVEKNTLKKYQQIKAGLMQDLLTGKVEVQTDDVA